MILGLTGYAQSGKDTVANRLVERHGFTRMAFADKLKALALAIDPYVRFGDPIPGFCRLSVLVQKQGWDAAKKNEDVRRLLQRTGDEGVRQTLGPDIWVEAVKRELPDKGRVVISDVRYENEVTICDRIWRIERPGFGPVNSHKSEILPQRADLTIVNENTITDLNTTVDEIVRFYGLE